MTTRCINSRSLSSLTYGTKLPVVWYAYDRYHDICHDIVRHVNYGRLFQLKRKVFGLYIEIFYCGISTVAEWLACWSQAQKARVQISVATLSCNSLRQTVHTHCASVHQAAKLVAALLRVVGVTADMEESNGSLPPGLWLTSPAGWLPRTVISSGTLRSVIDNGLLSLFLSTNINSYRTCSRYHSAKRSQAKPSVEAGTWSSQAKQSIVFKWKDVTPCSPFSTWCRNINRVRWEIIPSFNCLLSKNIFAKNY